MEHLRTSGNKQLEKKLLRGWNHTTDQLIKNHHPPSPLHASQSFNLTTPYHLHNSVDFESTSFLFAVWFSVLNMHLFVQTTTYLSYLSFN